MNHIFDTSIRLQLQEAGFKQTSDVIDFLQYHMGCGIIFPENIQVDFFKVLSELKKSKLWVTGVEYKGVTIREFPVSEKCRQALANNGIATIEEVIQIVEYALITGLRAFLTPAKWAKYMDEIIIGLQKMGCWPECDK